VGPRTCLDAVKKKKNFSLSELNPELCVVQPVAVAITNALTLKILRKITKGLRQCSPCSGRDSNRLLAEHKLEILRLEPGI
jgi:hypothetical protein